MINRMKRFKLKMLGAITFGAFTTFTVLLYISSETVKCDSTSNILCFYVYKEENMSPKKIIREETRTRNERHYHLIQKENIYMLKMTENSSNLRNQYLTRYVTPWSDLRQRRNIYYGPQLSSFNYLTSSLNNETEKIMTAKGLEAPGEYVYLYPNKGNSNDKKLNLLWTKNNFSYYLERKRNLYRECEKYNVSQILKVKRVSLNHILIDENRKILFCYVPKVACTNWKRIFMLLTGKANNISEVIRIPSYKVHARNLFTTLRNYSLSEVSDILRDYTKFIFVRNPFERLLSAYHNKLEQHYDSSKYFQARFGKYIVKKFRKNPSNVSLEKGDDVTFSEFANYLISSNPDSYNEHWQTVTNLCHPCYINYDFIGKYETLLEDSKFVLKYLKMNISFPVLERPSRTASSLKKYFLTVDKDIIYKLYNIYEMDFKIFGYDLFKTLNW